MKTTISNPATPCPADHVNRQFRAPRPNLLRVSDFTPAHAGGRLYVSRWSGFVCVAFVIDTFARRIVGWQASRTAPIRTLSWTRWSRPSTTAGRLEHDDLGSGHTLHPLSRMLGRMKGRAADPEPRRGGIDGPGYQ